MEGADPGHQLIPAITGPTASGKARLALGLAEKYPVKLVSVDSRKIYRGMDIGTAKPPPEIRAKHFLLMDTLEPDASYSAQDFALDAERAISEILRGGRVPVLVGGTVLYFKALFEGLFPAPPVDRELRKRLLARISREGSPALHRELARVDPASAGRIHPNDWVRVERALEIFMLTGKPMSELLKERRKPMYKPYYITRPVDRAALYRRINQRLDEMMERGFLGEVKRLLESHGPSAPGLKTIGYRELVRHLLGEMSQDEAVALAKKNTRIYARRQIYFARRLGRFHSPEEGEALIRSLSGG